MNIPFLSSELKTRIVLNPFILFALVWVLVLIVYLFDFSTIYPAIDLNLFVFYLLIIACSLFLAFIYQRKFLPKHICFKISNPKPAKVLAVVCVLSFLVEVFYTKSIPLISTLLGQGGSYQEFGIPSLTFVFVSLRIALVAISSVKIFYCTKYKMGNIICLLIPLIIFCLVYTRGILIFSLIIFGLLGLSRFRFSLKSLLLVFALFLLFAFVFNVTGNIRQGAAWDDSSYLEAISGFRYPNTVLSHFSWALVYFGSPLGNLNFNVCHRLYEMNLSGLLSQLIPDFLSKRIWPEYNSEIVLVQPGLTASSIFAGSYKYGGFLGMIFAYIEFACVLFLIPLFCRKNNKLFLAATASVSAMAIMSFFTNTFIYSGYSFFTYFLLLARFIEGKDQFKMHVNGKPFVFMVIQQ